MLEGPLGGSQGGQETGFDTRLLGWEQQVLCSTESPLHVGDSMDKNFHSTGKEEGLCVESKQRWALQHNAPCSTYTTLVNPPCNKAWAFIVLVKSNPGLVGGKSLVI